MRGNPDIMMLKPRCLTCWCRSWGRGNQRRSAWRLPFLWVSQIAELPNCGTMVYRYQNHKQCCYVLSHLVRREIYASILLQNFLKIRRFEIPAAVQSNATPPRERGAVVRARRRACPNYTQTQTHIQSRSLRIFVGRAATAEPQFSVSIASAGTQKFVSNVHAQCCRLRLRYI